MASRRVERQQQPHSHCSDTALRFDALRRRQHDPARLQRRQIEPFGAGTDRLQKDQPPRQRQHVIVPHVRGNQHIRLGQGRAQILAPCHLTGTDAGAQGLERGDEVKDVVGKQHVQPIGRGDQWGHRWPSDQQGTGPDTTWHRGSPANLGAADDIVHCPRQATLPHRQDGIGNQGVLLVLCA